MTTMQSNSITIVAYTAINVWQMTNYLNETDNKYCLILILNVRSGVHCTYYLVKSRSFKYSLDNAKRASLVNIYIYILLLLLLFVCLFVYCLLLSFCYDILWWIKTIIVHNGNVINVKAKPAATARRVTSYKAQPPPPTSHVVTRVTLNPLPLSSVTSFMDDPLKWGIRSFTKYKIKIKFIKTKKSELKKPSPAVQAEMPDMQQVSR